MKKVLLSLLVAGSIISCENMMNNGESFEPVAVSDEIKMAKVEGEIFTMVETSPEFPGGMSKMYEYIGQNLKYPEAAQRDNIQGKVFVKFVVTKDGDIGKIETLKGIGYGCEEEVARILAGMPTWKPAEQDGEKVNVYFTMPIAFRLE
ncbi:MAG: energy transducer TonB [Spirosomaceae bacterium]|nr:energy transducer TonB [Spirosomataceae bacterium]